MAPLPTLPGVVRSSWRGLMPSGRQWANVIHARFNGGITQPAPTDITALDTALLRLYTGTAHSGGAAHLTHCGSGTTLIDTTYYPLDGSAIPTIGLHAAVGSSVAQTLPPEVAAVVTLRSGFRGRSNRGRIYLPAPTVTFITSGGNWSTTFMSEILNQITGIVAALAAVNWKLGIASYLTQPTQNGLPFGAPVSPHWSDLVSATMDAKPDVQRRRK